MDIQNVILLVVLMVNLSLGVIVYVHGRQEKVNRVFSFVTVTVFFWAFSMIMFRIQEDITSSLFWSRVLYFSAVSVVGVFLYFTHIFPQGRPILLWKKILMLTGTGIVVLFVWWPGMIIHNVQIVPIGEKVLLWGPFYFLYILYILGFFTWAFGELIYRYAIQTEGVIKVQIQYVLLGTLIAAIIGVTANLILPSIGIFTLNWFGQIGTVIMIGLIAYAITRHHLLNIKVITTEALIVFILSILLVEVFLSKSLIEFILRFVFTVVVGILSFLLVRSVLNEVQQKEQLQVMTEQLASANKELERLDQAKSEFLSIASHQLRTPLTAIKGYGSMLLDGTFGPVQGKVREGIERVFQSTERMVALVNDLLDTSRLESGRMQFNFVETDLGEIVKSVCDEIMPKAQEKQLQISCAIPTSGLPKVFVDQMKIRQVIINLIDNAIKYSDTGTVEVKVRQDAGELVFSVKDQGWGMTPEEMGFLFKKFSRGRGDTSHIKGTGLGLYVCRRLVEAHGGRVWAESEGKGKGSTFLFALKVNWRPSTDGVYMPKDE